MQVRVLLFPAFHTHADSTSSGIETVGCAPRLFPCLAMTHKHPEYDVHRDTQLHHAQTRVAAEMGDIVGRDQMSTLADLPNLPYFHATWRECLWWGPPLPLCESTVTVPGISFLMGLMAVLNVAIPHKSTEEDVCDGYRIPKGSIIYSNVAYVMVYPARRGFALIATRYRSFMLNDTSVWPQPRSFKSERFLHELTPDQFDPKGVVFGFGRWLVPHPVHSTGARNDSGFVPGNVPDNT